MGEGLDGSLRRRVETLSEKNEATDLARDGLSVEDGSEVMCLRVYVFPEEAWVGD